jgi:glycosyltransferase involved in cell wall biosynthesis
MNWPAECAVIIPCLNESATIESLVLAVRAQLPAVIVVDDGSGDGTSAVAARAGAEVVRHDRPLGKGAALQSGWSAARRHGFRWVLTMDGDGQHSAADIPVFLRCAEATGAELIVGNRMGNPAAMPLVRRWVNRWMSCQISRRAGRSLPDSQSGFRLIRLSALPATVRSTQHFEIESEVLLSMAREGRGIEFVPIQVIYKAERSKIHPLHDTLRWFRWFRKQ